MRGRADEGDYGGKNRGKNGARSGVSYVESVHPRVSQKKRDKFKCLYLLHGLSDFY